jgi:CheY-like chemotaxis protein
MSTPVVICDDSGFARKQIARALPAGWDVTITFAANGRECLEALRAHRGDILFLDLTMPDMDGFEVLRIIREQDLPTLPIVVSGDIQAESRQRVMQLGAVAFLKKPVVAAELESVLKDYGVLGVLTAETPLVAEPVEFGDWCQEIANVAMGRAAELLSRVIDIGVHLSIPQVSQLEQGELMMALGLANTKTVAAVSQGFIGAGISGETLLLFDEADMAPLAQMMKYRGELSDDTERELLMDVANVLVGAFLKGLAEQLDIQFSQGHPLLHLHRRQLELLEHGEHERRTILAIELSYNLGANQVHCDQLILFTEQSAQVLRRHAGAALI